MKCALTKRPLFNITSLFNFFQDLFFNIIEHFFQCASSKTARPKDLRPKDPIRLAWDYLATL